MPAGHTATASRPQGSAPRPQGSPPPPASLTQSSCLQQPTLPASPTEHNRPDLPPPLPPPRSPARYHPRCLLRHHLLPHIPPPRCCLWLPSPSQTCRNQGRAGLAPQQPRAVVGGQDRAPSGGPTGGQAQGSVAEPHGGGGLHPRARPRPPQISPIPPWLAQPLHSLTGLVPEMRACSSSFQLLFCFPPLPLLFPRPPQHHLDSALLQHPQVSPP